MSFTFVNPYGFQMNQKRVCLRFNVTFISGSSKNLFEFSQVFRTNSDSSALDYFIEDKKVGLLKFLSVLVTYCWGGGKLYSKNW